MKNNIYKILLVVSVTFIAYYIFKPLPSVQNDVAEQKATTVIEDNTSQVSVEEVAERTAEEDSNLDIYEIDDFRLGEQLEHMMKYDPGDDEELSKVIAYFIDEKTGIDCSVEDFIRCEPEYKSECFNKHHKNKEESECITYRKLCKGQQPSNQSLEFSREMVVKYFKNEKLAKSKFNEYIKTNFVHNCSVIRHNEQKIVECEVLDATYCYSDSEKVEKKDTTSHCRAASHFCIKDT